MSRSLKIEETRMEVETEKKRHEIFWKLDDYRHSTVNHGYKYVNQVYYTLKCKPGEMLVDYGCGTGEAAREFALRGLRVTAIDHAENCLNTYVQKDPTDNKKDLFLFQEMNLWSIPDMFSGGDYAFCTNVLETLPEEQVGSVVKLISQFTRQGGYFVVSTTDAYWAQEINLTVKPEYWWKQIFNKYLTDLSFYDMESSGGKLFITWRKNVES